ncbi:MAG TPA: 2-dehydropantoate 2-reductase [Pyrinomonadaceae bacterium]|nr:2-dehydropantoate 2-reductase [Pyrinomonadaceae bacterium]
MRIAIFGTGGAGGYFGAHLAKAGEEVVFIARGEHLKAIRERGLRVETNAGEIVASSEATDDPAQVGAVDVVLVGVKTWQVTDAARAMRPMISPQTFVVPLQNGIEAAAELAAVLGAEHVLGGLCGTISRVISPGHILSIGETNFIKFGELDNRPSERARLLRQTFERAGVKAEVPTDIQAAVWEKFIFVTPYGGIGAVTRVPAGVIRTLPETRRMLETGMREIFEVARARRVSLAEGIVEKSMGLVDSLAPSATASLQRDISAGKPSELEAWNGAVVRLGREAGVPTPLHEFIYHSLLPTELQARGKAQFSETPQPDNSSNPTAQ